MIEEPYRWVDAIANRREYIETQLAGGAPVIAASFEGGILLATIGTARQKIFEIYDRIALGAIGHPGDIERLRMAAIDIASTEGFTRSAADVSLRRLAHFSLSPVLKAAFEQVYGPPYLTRLLFAELGATMNQDLFLRLDFDGTIASEPGERFAVLAPTRDAAAQIETNLREHLPTAGDLPALIGVLRAGLRSSLGDSGGGELQAALLDRTSTHSVRYRQLEPNELS